MSKSTLLFIIGTRPEAIKLAPLIKEAEKYPELLKPVVCVTGQHREMLDQVLSFFEINPDIDLNVMRDNQGLLDLSAVLLSSLKSVLLDYSPDYVIVQGDTTTCMIGALSGFYSGIKVCHVEAGLRTYNKNAPFPEEVNRQLTSRLADIHFAPTTQAKEFLLNEGISSEDVLVTGNTVIDALLWGNEKNEHFVSEEIKELSNMVISDRKLILVTGHRRENFGVGFKNICEAIKEIAMNDKVQVIYPVHLNPNVQKPVYELLDGLDNVHLIKPLAYEAFIWLMKASHFILTDSGGIQEEAPSLGKPVLVMRETTERQEAIEAGYSRLVGTDKDVIITMSRQLLSDTDLYTTMSNAGNPYGDGKASEKIISYLLKTLA